MNTVFVCDDSLNTITTQEDDVPVPFTLCQDTCEGGLACKLLMTAINESSPLD